MDKNKCTFYITLRKLTIGLSNGQVLIMLIITIIIVINVRASKKNWFCFCFSEYDMKSRILFSGLSPPPPFHLLPTPMYWNQILKANKLASGSSGLRWTSMERKSLWDIAFRLKLWTFQFWYFLKVHNLLCIKITDGCNERKFYFMTFEQNELCSASLN
jgi:hypothetical protein